MKKLIMMLSVALSFSLSSGLAFADASIEALTTCISKSVTTEDRKQLITWLFTSMHQHPDMQAIAAIEPEAVKQYTEKTGNTFNRLLTKDCLTEVNTAIQANNTNAAMQSAFHHLGRLAMQEMMANPSVGKGMSRPSKYIELNKLNK